MKMFLLVRTFSVRVNDVEYSLKSYHAVKAYLDRDRIQFQVLEKSNVKALQRNLWKRSSLFKKSFRLVFSAKQIVDAFKIDTSLLPSELPNNQISQLSTESTSQQTAQWLRENGFGGYVSTFVNFSGADILRLTRDDLIQICGLADGIRLLNALHSKGRLTLYICFSSSAIYHAVYLNHIGISEMSRKLATLLGVHHNQIHNIFLQGPNNIRVLITDEVVSNIKDESMFSIEVLKDESRARLFLLLKPTVPKT